MRTIPLTRGQEAIVDDQDFDSLAKHNWFALPKRHGFYAARNIRIAPNKQQTVYMHKVVAGVGKGIEVDHRNGNKLDNQRLNLRVATRRTQMRGFLSKPLDATSKYRGVCWCATNSKWLAQIRVDGKTKFLGYHASEVDAAKAYNNGAARYFGEDATPNQIQ